MNGMRELALPNSPEDGEYEIRNRVFLGGLYQKATELELENFFSDYGSVQDVRIVCDRKTGKSKGFGFVTFMDESTAGDLIKKGSVEYQGLRIRLRKAVRRVLGGQYNGGFGGLYVKRRYLHSFQGEIQDQGAHCQDYVCQELMTEPQRVLTQNQPMTYILDNSPQMLYPYGIPFHQPVESNMCYYNTCMMPPYAPVLASVPPTQYAISYY